MISTSISPGALWAKTDSIVSVMVAAALTARITTEMVSLDDGPRGSWMDGRSAAGRSLLPSQAVRNTRNVGNGRGRVTRFVGKLLTQCCQERRVIPAADLSRRCEWHRCMSISRGWNGHPGCHFTDRRHETRGTT